MLENPSLINVIIKLQRSSFNPNARKSWKVLEMMSLTSNFANFYKILAGNSKPSASCWLRSGIIEPMISLIIAFRVTRLMSILESMI